MRISKLWLQCSWVTFETIQAIQERGQEGNKGSRITTPKQPTLFFHFPFFSLITLSTLSFLPKWPNNDFPPIPFLFRPNTNFRSQINRQVCQPYHSIFSPFFFIHPLSKPTPQIIFPFYKQVLVWVGIMAWVGFDKSWQALGQHGLCVAADVHGKGLLHVVW